MDGSSAGPRSGPAELLVRLYRRFLETAPTAPHLTYDLVAGASASAERSRKLVAAASPSLARRRRVAEIRTNSSWSLQRWLSRHKAWRDIEANPYTVCVAEVAVEETEPMKPPSLRPHLHHI